jgi:GDPmannose 4,6-dehydratase
VYNLSGQSSVALSFGQPVETLDSIAFGTLNLLEAIRFNGRATKLYNAGSSECFGDVPEGPADESTPFRPRSPYAVAKAAAFVEVDDHRVKRAQETSRALGILFNHESPLRPERFVTRRIAAACRIAAGAKGETPAARRMSASPATGAGSEYVEAMWRMPQRGKPGRRRLRHRDGKTHRLQEFVEAAFARLSAPTGAEHVVLQIRHWRDPTNCGSAGPTRRRHSRS